jgi:asparagine synthase (glutamine-hydrolysing)
VELLMKQDQMSMAASIESRVPFLDHHLVEFAAALPPRMKLRGLTTKWILRQAVQRLLPREILTRRKMGFPVPFGMWMRGAWADTARDVLLDRRTRQRGVIDPSGTAALIDAHQAGTVQGGDAIWGLLNLELWYRTFIDGNGIQTLNQNRNQNRNRNRNQNQNPEPRTLNPALNPEPRTLEPTAFTRS